MTNHRVNDLSFGHLGEASYDTQYHRWSFLRLTGLQRVLRPIEHLQECVPPSSSVVNTSTQNRSNASLLPIKWLRREFPEIETGLHLRSSLNWLIQEADNVHQPHPSKLLDVGQAIDLRATSEARNLQIIATPHGEAGEILRLLNPRATNLKWENSKGIRLRTIHPAVSEDGFWLADGGAIQQIVFGAGAEGPSSWLAVRKEVGTTILRPVYHPFPVPAADSGSLRVKLPPSRLSPNAILTLSVNQTGCRPHVDVAFNPWYVRRFAVIDEGGFWSIWDIEGQERKRRHFEPVISKSGHIYDDDSSDQLNDRIQERHEWAKILWAGNSNTLVACNRHHLAVFDLQAKPKRLPGSDIITTIKTGWILDAKRSPSKLDQIFVLTTSHLLWLEILPADECTRVTSGTRILLSYRHFRDGEDDTMKLELVEDGEVCIALIYAATSPLVNSYHFSINEDDATPYHCISDGFSLGTVPGGDSATPSIYDLALIPASFVKSTRFQASGPGSIYHDEGVQFYQLIGLHATFSISQALCVTSVPSVEGSNNAALQHAQIEVPTADLTSETKKASSYCVEDDFIVLDDYGDPGAHYTDTGRIQFPRPDTEDGGRRFQYSRKRASFNAQHMFDLAFPDKTGRSMRGSSAMTDYVHHIAQNMDDRWTNAVQGSHTALELAGFDSFSDDIDEAAAALSELLDTFEKEKEAEDQPLNFGLYTVQQNLFSGDDESSDSGRDLSKIYDRLIESWISCLPHITPGPVRLAKERVIRTIAAELCLSSQVVSLLDRSAQIQSTVQEDEPDLPVYSYPDNASDLSQKFEKQDSLNDLPRFNRGLLTPAQTPSTATSIVSTDNSVYSDGPAEDEAITRLRNYAISTKPQRSLGTAGSSILAHWPSTPGSDPYQYSWEATNIALGRDVEADSDQENSKHRKEAERRRRRTEKFLARLQIDPPGNSSSQKIVPTFGSDPAGPLVASSSQVPEMGYPMTQPANGIFGSRKVHKKHKKQRTKGF